MAIDLTGRHFLKELDFTTEEFRHLVELAAEL
jgi:ornithine carbamoyltransferase